MPYKEALEEKLKELQEEYARTKYNKVTDKHLGLLRARMAKLRKEIEEKSKKKSGKGFAVKKTGDATVVLVGFPKAGKSSLLNLLTNAQSKVADYEFTTLDVIPGIMEYQGAKIQLLDVPGIIEGAHMGKGQGTKVASVMRTADLLLIVVDATAASMLGTLLKELEKLNIKVNKQRPKVLVEKTSSGGIEIEGAIDANDKEVLKKALLQAGIYNARVAIGAKADIDEILEEILENVTYIKAIIALNKIDLIGEDNASRLAKEIEEETQIKTIPISVATGKGIEALKEELFKSIGLMRIYLKPKDEEADMQRPMIMHEGSSVEDLAKKLNAKTAKFLKYAYVKGKSAKFENQKVGKEHVLSDGDIVTLVYEKHV